MLVLAALLGCNRAPRASVLVVPVQKQQFTRVIEADGHLRAVRSTPVTAPSEAEWPMRITWLFADGSAVKKGETVARFDDLELKGRLHTAESELAVATAKEQKESVLLRAALRDRRRVVTAAQRELILTRDFARRDTEIFSRDQIIESEIDQKLQQDKVENARDMGRVDGRLGRNKLGLIAVEARKAADGRRRSEQGLKALQIAAPHDGVFTLRRNWRGDTIHVGDTVFRSMSVAEIALTETMEVEVFVLEAEAAGLAEGRQAEVLIDGQTGPPVAARIKQVETVAKRRESRSPTQYFGVILTLLRTEMQAMKPGQRVRARLHLHEQQALVVPRPALFDRDGHWVVYRKDPAGAFAPVPVTLGPSTAGLVTVEAGLREGDLVALRDPIKAADELLPAATSQQGGPR